MKCTKEQINLQEKSAATDVNTIIADRHNLNGVLRKYEFDAVLDICGYNENDIRDLLCEIGDFGIYIFVSSGAVYPETLPQPFSEEMPVGADSVWGDYGTNKIAAEKYLCEKVSNAYIIRPPYLYGKMNNLYREAFVFECAEQECPFYIPNYGRMGLQFFDIEDMCRFMKAVIEKQPKQHIFNVGNPKSISVADWVSLCYKTVGKTADFHFVKPDIEQRNFFPFYNYEYKLNVEKMLAIMPDVKPLEEGLMQSYEWFADNRTEIRRKNLTEFIDNNLRG